jgi:23S rRNA pseudoU1915 N3-methylase RlmH
MHLRLIDASYFYKLKRITSSFQIIRVNKVANKFKRKEFNSYLRRLKINMQTQCTKVVANKQVNLTRQQRTRYACASAKANVRVLMQMNFNNVYENCRFSGKVAKYQ